MQSAIERPPGSSVAVQSGGKILIGGFFKTYNGTARSGIAQSGPNALAHESSS